MASQKIVPRLIKKASTEEPSTEQTTHASQFSEMTTRSVMYQLKSKNNLCRWYSDQTEKTIKMLGEQLIQNPENDALKTAYLTVMANFHRSAEVMRYEEHMTKTNKKGKEVEWWNTCISKEQVSLTNFSVAIRGRSVLLIPSQELFEEKRDRLVKYVRENHMEHKIRNITPVA